MKVSLKKEIRQRKPFASVYEEAFLNVARTEAVLRDGLDRVLVPRGLSLTQYNVLRVLRGAGEDGLCRNEIRDRLITRMPDVSRLLDRMEGTGLVRRVRSTEDRRLVTTTLTKQGQTLVDDLDDAVTGEHKRQLAHLTTSQLRSLIELLSLARRTG